MQFFRNLKIVKKLFAYYAVILVGVLVLSYFSMEDIYHIDRYYYQATRLTQMRVEHVLSAQTQLARANGAQLMGDDALMNQALNSLQSDLNSILTLSQAAANEGIGGFHSIRHDISDALAASFTNFQQSISVATSLVADYRAGNAAAFDSLSNQLHNLSRLSFDYMNAVKAVVHHEATRSIVSMSAIIISVVVIVTLLTLLLAKTVSTPIKRLGFIVSEISKGNLEVNFDNTRFSKDEIGELAQNVYELDNTIKTIVGDLTTTHHKYLKVGDMYYQIDESKYQNSFKEMIGLVNGLTAQVTEDIKSMAEVLGHISQGDFDQKINEVDWVGDWAFMPRAFNQLTANLKSVSIEVNTMIAAIAERGDLGFKIDCSKHEGDWRKIMEGLNSITNAIDEPIKVVNFVLHELKAGNFNLEKIDQRLIESGLAANVENYKGVFKDMLGTFEDAIVETSSYIDEIKKILGQVADGNLHDVIQRQYAGSFEMIKTSVNSIVVRLNETVTDIAMVADGVSSGSMQLSESSMDLSEGVSRQMLAMQEMGEGISLVDMGAKDNSQNAQKAAQLALTSKANAEVSNSEMKHLLNAMERINESSSEISNIISTIEGIAFQTNLLALNASVEAARAGEHGRGFSVVADEVRSLAARSAEAAKQTASLIQESIDNVEDGKKAATDTAASLDKIVKNVVDVSDVINGIFESSTKQTGAISGINNDLQQISQVVQASAATSEETAAAAEELDAQVSILKEKLSFFSTNLSALSVAKVWDATTSDRINATSLKNAPGERKQFGHGELIVKEGDVDANSMFFVLEGNVNVVKSAGTLNEKTLATLKAGDLFGEMALFLNESRTADVVAQGNAVVSEIHRNTLSQFMESSPEAASAIIETLCRRLKNVIVDMESY